MTPSSRTRVRAEPVRSDDDAAAWHRLSDGRRCTVGLTGGRRKRALPSEEQMPAPGVRVSDYGLVTATRLAGVTRVLANGGKEVAKLLRH